MATIKQRTGQDRQEARTAIQEAAAQAAEERGPLPTSADRQVSIRLTEYEHNELKAAYAKEGVKLATGIKTAALWALKTGLTVTRAGVIDRKR
ncbi:MAG: hypothetical protein LBC46_06595 [Treponema sp.]|jgi:hypothetical protein|nr:hypothetical protein [Treponema sp.]